MPEGQIKEVVRLHEINEFHVTMEPVQIWLAAPKILRSESFGVFCFGILQIDTGRQLARRKDGQTMAMQELSA